MITSKLKAFVKTAELGSFRKAGEALWLSSIAVKKQVDGLEADLGVRLFDRTNRGVTLTESGVVLLEGARSLEALSNAIVADARRAATDSDNVIRIGMSYLRPGQPIVDLWTNAPAHSAPCTFSFVPFGDSPQDLTDALGRIGTDIDCILAHCDSDAWHKSHNILVTALEPLRIAIPTTHPLAAKETITWDDLDGESLIIPITEDFPTVTRLYHDITAHHPLIRIKEAPSNYDVDVFNRCLAEGSCLLAYDLWEGIHPSLVVKPVEWDYLVPYGIVYAKDPSPAVAQFIADIAAGLIL
ncbi:LysR family transcriptional regulator [Adlercreutzia sp. R7]|uniref:LysR family transcriptional regulator n=1 Tax=Adlercreutzia wanghongyangiae TaxID=3111451 RepID=A0ABU6IKT9_9ACTN|nr:LysR family transcriptional regulator [Adlercreutzia sp. R7]